MFVPEAALMFSFLIEDDVFQLGTRDPQNIQELSPEVTAHPEDSTAFLQLVGVHVQLGEAIRISKCYSNYSDDICL